MSGNADALRDMIANMAHGGRIALLGIPPEEFAIDWNQVVFNMLTIKGIYGREMYETWYAMSVMVQSGLDISPVITHHFGRDDTKRRSPPPPAVRPARSSCTGGTEMYSAVKDQLTSELDEIRAAGLYKAERVIGTPAERERHAWAATRS